MGCGHPQTRAHRPPLQSRRGRNSRPPSAVTNVVTSPSRVLRRRYVRSGSHRYNRRAAALLPSAKWKRPCSEIYGCVRSLISISLVRVASHCLRRARDPTARIPTATWETGTGLSLYCYPDPTWQFNAYCTTAPPC
jgi:hypothetical protein